MKCHAPVYVFRLSHDISSIHFAKPRIMMPKMIFSNSSFGIIIVHGIQSVKRLFDGFICLRISSKDSLNMFQYKRRMAIDLEASRAHPTVRKTWEHTFVSSFGPQESNNTVFLFIAANLRWSLSPSSLAQFSI